MLYNSFLEHLPKATAIERPLCSEELSNLREGIGQAGVRVKVEAQSLHVALRSSLIAPHGRTGLTKLLSKIFCV